MQTNQNSIVYDVVVSAAVPLALQQLKPLPKKARASCCWIDGGASSPAAARYHRASLKTLLFR